MIYMAFEGEAVLIFTSCDDNYVPYAMVMLNSIIQNASPQNNYDIIVFECSMSEENKKRLEAQSIGFEHISIRVINIHTEVEFDEKMLVTRTLTKEIWLKVLGIYALKEYRKGIVIDCDVICLDDIAELYHVEIGENLIGAVKFLNMYIYKQQFLNRRFCDGLDHGIDAREEYFNYGVVLQNMEKFRETYTLEYLLTVISTQNYRVQDQDMMNVLCKGRVKWVDSKWNTFPFMSEEFNNTISMVDDGEKEYWVKGYEHPSCIHYTIPVKPWLERNGVYSYATRYFWKYAISLKNFDFSFFKNQVAEYEKNKKFLCSIVKKTYAELGAEEKNTKLFVYGFGMRGREIYKKNLFTIAGFVDSDENKWGNQDSVMIGGLDLLDDAEHTTVLISNDNWEKLALMLHNRGIKRIYSYACLEKRDYLSWDVEVDDLLAVNQCFELLGDEKSKVIYDKLLSKRHNFLTDRTIKHLDLQEGNQYFRTDFFTWREDETYVDIGSFSHHVVEEFEKFTNRKYHKIYQFEVQENEELELIQQKAFAELCESGEEVTFIRLNVNHTKEIVSSLRGMIEINLPKMAIELSNNYSDLWEIPLLIDRLHLGYKFYIRHHMSDYTGTVLYAVGKKNYEVERQCTR